jgi:hypothetical protein
LLLAVSDERDLQLRLRLGAWREGYAAGRAPLADEYERGWTDGVLAYKAAQHNFVTDLQQHLVTWDGLRERFGQPRPGDFPGRGEGA